MAQALLGAALDHGGLAIFSPLACHRHVARGRLSRLHGCQVWRPLDPPRIPWRSVMLQNPRAPLYFGTVVILALAVYLAAYHPTPGELSRAHAQVERFSVFKGCSDCHSPTGLADGCLSCHDEIKSQLNSGKGLHHHLLSGKKVECSHCHQEHNGKIHGLMGSTAWEGKNQQEFKHPHVTFRLVGAHSELLCSDCHKTKGRKAFTLAKFP